MFLCLCVTTFLPGLPSSVLVMSCGFEISSFSFQRYDHLIKWLCEEPHLKDLLCMLSCILIGFKYVV